MVTTDIGYTTPDAITVRGLNLADDILGKLDFVDMLCLLALQRRPFAGEKAMLNLLLVTAADHGLTPSALAARLTFLGAPEALQGAVAAGLLGAGSVFLGPAQQAAETLIATARELTPEASGTEIDAAAEALVRRAMDAKKPIVGVGHPIHVGGDPRVPVLRAQAHQHGCYGIHWRLMDAIPGAIARVRRRELPLNAIGAVAAIVADMGLDPLLGRGLMLVGRCAGLVAHLLEEKSAPIGQQLWDLVLAQDPRNVTHRTP